MILGAGISGMAAAWELSKAGYHCTILEATGRAGGRSFTARGGDVLEETDSRQQVDFGGEDHLYANMGPAPHPLPPPDDPRLLQGVRGRSGGLHHDKPRGPVPQP